MPTKQHSQEDNKTDPIIVESVNDELLGFRIEKAKTEKHYTTEEACKYLGL